MKSQRLASTVFGLLILLASTTAFAQLKFKQRWEISAAAQHREINQVGLSENDSQLDQFLLLSFEQIISYNSWALELRPEIRALLSPSLETAPTDISRIAIIDTTREMDLHQQLSPSENQISSSHLIVSDIEKLNIRYQGTNLEFVAGRNPFNPSIMRLAPIWNKFGKDVFYLGYPNLQFNPDMTSLKYTRGNFWIQNANVIGNDEIRNAYLLITGFNLQSVELQAMAGQIWEEPTVGLNANISTEESLIKSEILHVAAKKNPQNKHTQAALGYETSWTESLSTVTELIYSNLADQFADPNNITLGASAFFKLRSNVYLANQFDYQFSEIWTGSLIPIINIDDSSFILSAALRGSLTDNLEATFNAKYGFGSDGTEFSSKSVSLPLGRSLGYSNTASVMLRYFF